MLPVSVVSRTVDRVTPHSTTHSLFFVPFLPFCQGGALEQQSWILLALTVHGGLVGAFLFPSCSLGLSAPYAEATLPPASARSPLVSNHTRTFPELERKITPLDQMSKPRLCCVNPTPASITADDALSARARCAIAHCAHLNTYTESVG